MSKVATFVRLLGEPGVELPSGTRAFGSDKRYSLLGYLAYEGEWVGRARLARLFWPDHDARAARHNLRQLLKRTASLPWLPDIESATAADGERLRWCPPTDVAALQVAVAEGRWAEAIELHRGRLLDGLRFDAEDPFAAWLDLEAIRVEDTARRGFLEMAAVLAEAGRHDAAARVGAHLLAREPFDEEALNVYVSASAAAGDRKRALDAYQRFAARLMADLGMAPSAATEALVERVRSGGVESSVAVTTDGPVEALQEPDAAVHTSTSKASALIGRELELSDAHRLLANPECRLLTITGPGGVGKSSLARQLAVELGEKYPAGVVVITPPSTRGVTGSADGLVADIATGVAESIGVPGAGRTLIDVTRAIGGKRVLLVLDDLDEFHAETQFLSDLLGACPALAVVCTTRERLGLGSEWLLPLDGLSYPEPGAGTATGTLAAYDSVRLFVARAERLRPGYYLSAEEEPGVARICNMVAGLPLAVELAAAWTRALSSAEIANEIGAGLELLTSGARGTAEKHASMRASIEHSWRRLSPEESRAWRDLAVIRSPFSRGTATRVADVRLPVLATLVDKSLLRSKGSGLFVFHPLLRAFAAEQLAQNPDEHAAMRAAHARHFLGLLDDACELTGAGRLSAAAAVESALDDVAAAWRTVMTAAADASGSGRVEGENAERTPSNAALQRWGANLSEFCDGQARYALAADLFGEAIGMLEAATTRAEVDPILMGSMKTYHGWHLYRLGRLSEADAAARHGLDLVTTPSSARVRRSALLTLGGIALQEGRYEEAASLFGKALDSATKDRDGISSASTDEIAALTGNLGVALQFMGDREGAAVQFRSQLTFLRRSGNQAKTASALSNLGNVLRILGRLPDAKSYLLEGLAIATAAGRHPVLPNLNINLGILHRQLDERDAARTFFLEGARLAQEHGRVALQVTAEFQLGRLSLDTGSIRAAATHFDRAIDLAVRSGSVSGVLDGLAGTAWATSRSGDDHLARRLALLVADHPGSLPGTRSWANELLAALNEGGYGSDEVLEPLSERLLGALSLLEVHSP